MAKNVSAVVLQGDSSYRIDLTGTNTGQIIIERRATTTGEWMNVSGTLPGTATSFIDTGTIGNLSYYYRTVGPGAPQPAGTAFGPVYTKPAAPSGLKVTRLSNTTLRIESATKARFEDRNEITDSVPGFTPITVGPLPAEVTAGSGAHSFTVVTRAPGATTPPADPAQAPAIAAVAAPLAPEAISPSSATTAVVGGQALFEWAHQPVDGSIQLQVEAQYRLVNFAWQSLFAFTGSEQTRLANVPGTAGNYEWRVRTRGLHADWSPWSLPSMLQVISRPVVTIQTPGLTWAKSSVRVSWSSYQAQGWPQAWWWVELYDGATLLEKRWDTGGATVVDLSARVENGRSYTVKVYTSHGGALSDVVSRTFEVSYAKPGQPALTATWLDDEGCMQLAVAATAGPASTSTITIERSLDGTTWTQIATGGTSYTARDWECRSNGATQYRATAWSPDGAAAETLLSAVADSQTIWLSCGAGFDRVARLPFNPSLELTVGRERSTRRHDGRELPVGYAGPGVSRTAKVGGTLLERVVPEHVSVAVAQMEAVAQDPSPVHLLRDPQGRTIYGSISEVSLTRASAGFWSYSFSIEETIR